MLDEALEVAKRFETIKEFRSQHPKLYSRIAKAKAYDVAFAHVRRIRVTQKEYDQGRHCTKCLTHKPIDNFLRVGAGSSRRRSICKTCHNEEGKRWRSENPERAKEIVSNSSKRSPEKVRMRSRQKRIKNPAAFAARDMLKRCLLLTGQRKSRTTESILGYSSKDLKQHISDQFVDGMSWDNWGEWHIDHIEPVACLVRRGVTDPAVINALSNLRPIWAKENLSKIWEARADRRN